MALMAAGPVADAECNVDIMFSTFLGEKDTEFSEQWVGGEKVGAERGWLGT